MVSWKQNTLRFVSMTIHPTIIIWRSVIGSVGNLSSGAVAGVLNHQQYQVNNRRRAVTLKNTSQLEVTLKKTFPKGRVFTHPSKKGHKLIWLVVSTHLKNISQIGSSPQVGMKTKKYLKPPPSHRIARCRWQPQKLPELFDVVSTFQGN